jgi:hypothetical protein
MKMNEESASGDGRKGDNKYLRPPPVRVNVSYEDDDGVETMEDPLYPMRHIITGKGMIVSMNHPYFLQLMDLKDFTEGKFPERCCLCNKNLKSHSFHPNGNNPDPLKTSGRCCDDCSEGRVRKLRESRMGVGLHPQKQPSNLVGWGPFGISYREEEGWSMEVKNRGGWVVYSTLYLKGRVVKKKKVRFMKSYD